MTPELEQFLRKTLGKPAIKAAISESYTPIYSCQCPYDGVDHSAGRCRNLGYVTVKRGGQVLRVCGECTMTGDIRIRE